MKTLALTNRNLKETIRDPISLVLTAALPAVLLLIFQVFAQFDPIFGPTALTPGIIVFGMVMVMFSAAMLLARDRETALFSRLMTAPVRPSEFVTGYGLPYVPVVIGQAAILFAIGAILGMEVQGNFLLVILVLLLAGVLFIGLGMIVGTLFTVKQVPFVYTAILLLTIFGGAWMDLEAMGGVLAQVGDWFPFAHAIDAVRDVMVDGAGFSAIASDFYWVLGYTVSIGALAVVLFRRRMLE